MLKKLEVPKGVKVYTSDEMLREKGFRMLVQEIKSVNVGRHNIREPATIVIIGGSHSAFSIAWLLINGPFRSPKQFDVPYEFTRQAKSGAFYM
jgi:hypothetical protein